MVDFYEHIDDYMNGLLTGEDLKQFEAAMHQNESLRIAVGNYNVAKDISEALLEVDMLETLRGLKNAEDNGESTPEATIRQISDSRSKGRTNKQKFNFRKWIAAASVIGFIAFAGWWMMEYNREAKYMKEVLAKVEWPINEAATKSVDTIGMTDLEKGIHFFELYQYENSVQFLEKYVLEIRDIQLISKGYEWLGAAYIKVDKKEEAIIALSKSKEKKAISNLRLLSND